MVLKLLVFLLYFTFSNAITANELKKLYLETIKQSKQWKFPVDNSEFATNTSEKCSYYGKYDFIIIGAGTAGAVVANRLSANGTYSVLLLEAGGEELEINQFLGNFYLTSYTESNWGYYAEPQEYSCRLGITGCLYPRGKVLGGSSSINGGMIVRGNWKDFDAWVALGNKGWSFEEVLPYYIKSENATCINGDDYYHGYKGPMHLSYNEPYQHEQLLMKGFNEFGLKNRDYNGKKQISVSNPQIAKKDGRRVSTNRAYLQPIKDKRKNLKILTRALATKIKFNDKFRATAVHFLNNHKCFKAKVNNEIIVSGGFINSPQLLLLSGVGPKNELKKFQIPLIQDLPVGKYLEEHPIHSPIMRIKTNLSLHYDSLDDLIRKTVSGKGESALPTSLIAMKDIKSKDEIIHYEIMCLYPPYNFLPELNENKPVDTNFSYILSIMLFDAKSRGNITLKSPDPMDFPKINPNCFSEEADRVSMYKAIKHVLRLLDTEAFKKMDASLDEAFLALPGCKKFDPKNRNDEEFWRCYILQVGTATLHGSGTCRMGVDVKNSVIDQKLKIHGIKNVRVVDASSFPQLPSGHPAATVIMLAEKASDIIIEDNKNLLKT